MGKYYDKLIQMNENLDKELMEKGIVNVELNTNDKLVKDDKTDIVKEDGENTIEISKDSLTDEQKKEILLDKGVDQKAIDNLKSSDELDGALTAATANDVKKESGGEEEDDNISEEVVIRMDAKVFQNEESGQNAIEVICNKFHYDPSTFKTVSLDPREDEPYEEAVSDDDNFGDNWVSIDTMNPSATTLP